VIERWSWRPNYAAPPVPAVFGYQFECRRLGANAVRYWNTRYIALISRNSTASGSSRPTARSPACTTPTTSTSTSEPARARQPPTTASTARSQRTPQPGSD
jgi:hypothetical protein